jgi:sRNA-binding carbon storage regulator CsrA
MLTFSDVHGVAYSLDVDLARVGVEAPDQTSLQKFEVRVRIKNEVV